MGRAEMEMERDQSARKAISRGLYDRYVSKYVLAKYTHHAPSNLL